MSFSSERIESEVVVIGSGIIGCSVAYHLASRGAHVRVIDQNEIPGLGCSFGNAGWMTPCFAMPLPMPGMLFKSIKWLLDPEGPFYIQPRLSASLVSWLLESLTCMNEKQARKAIEFLVKISQDSLTQYHKLAEESGVPFGFEEKGLLMASFTDEGVASAHSELKWVSPLGVPGEKLNREDVLRLEPTLKGPIKGGVYFPKEAHGEPHKIVMALVSQCKKLGVEFVNSVKVEKFNIQNEKLASVTTNRGEISAQQFVLATGSWSKSLAEQLDLNVPILGGKGYSWVIENPSVKPKIPVMFLERKIAITPHAHGLRVAGTLELVDQDFSMSERRVRAIDRGLREILPITNPLELDKVWTGLRPCTPDGLPLIGFVPHIPNLMMACGHQMLGLQSGLGTGSFVADLFEKKATELDSVLVSPDRF